MDFWGLVISTIIALILLIYLSKQKNKSQLQKIFILDVFLILCWDIGILLQNLICSNSDVDPYIFEYFVYIFVCFLPVAIFFTGLIFANTKIKFKKTYLLLFVIPITTIIIVWTNDLHHLFYVNYSLNINECITGFHYYIHFIYNFILYALGLLYLLRYSIKNSGVFSKQAVLFTIATLIPLGSNILGSLGIISMSVYMTPILFTITILLCAIAIFKFSFLKSTPIALQRIADRISDGYLVLDENNSITDFNSTLLEMFNLDANYLRGKNLFTLIKEKNIFAINEALLKDSIIKVRNSDETLHFEAKLDNEEKYFNVEINSIRNNNNFLGTLILFKDTTQHMLDMKTIQDNQNMLMQRERLASLGQLIGGIAHNLKTPIMSISGAAEGLTDLVKEYKTSVGDPEVTVQDHYDISNDMTEWIQKIKEYTEYMSDVITAVKGQAVTMSEEQDISFTLDELVKRITILMRHELKNALVSLNVSMQVDEHTILKGNINSLVQVINNMISNAIQSYNGEPDKQIDLTLQKINDNINISIKDYGMGLPEKVQAKLFKEMITTKGKNGTGLGLFMSYSTIRAHFNGNITFETAEGKGTIFHITLPV